MKALIIEDDYLWIEELELDLQNGFPGIEVDKIESELGFRQWAEKIEKADYAFVVLDIMIEWQEATTDRVKPPEDVRTDGYFNAGIRILSRLREIYKGPIFIHSNRDPDAVGKELDSHRIDRQAVVILSKGKDSSPLIRDIRKRLGC